MTKPLIAALVLVASGAAAHALPLVNGDFENGLSGWYSTGWTNLGPNGSNTAVVTAASPYAPISGSSAMIVAVSGQSLGPNWSCAQDVWNLACPLPMPFAPGAPARRRIRSRCCLPSFTTAPTWPAT